MKSNYLIIALLFTLVSCGQEPPKPYGAIPTNAQLSWHEMEYFSLVCYGLNSYTEEEWAYGNVDPALFNPSDLDTDQWARVASEAGMKGLILVAKHHDGFCLWPSKFTNYSVAATPWRNGEGDVMGDLAKSCEKYGLKLGVYLSPWDRNHAEYGRPEYVQYFYDQLEELLSNYGDIFEFWIDGANGGTGYYGGADEKRNIDRTTYYGYDKIFSIVKKHQPNAVIFSDVGPGTRWVGNENGIGGETNWNTISTDGKYPGEPDPNYHKKLQNGEEGGNEWTPAEVNTTLLWPKAWYHKTGHQSRSLNNLMELYYTSIGRGSPLNLGLAIAPTGQISEKDTKALFAFKKQLDREFEYNLIAEAKLSASDRRGFNFKIENCSDGLKDSYWASKDQVSEAFIDLDFKKPVEFNRLVLQEYIALGQRINEFAFEIEKNGDYQTVWEGTTVGYKRVLKFERVKTSKARLRLKTNAPCLTLSEIGIYNAPNLVAEPIPVSKTSGEVSFTSDTNISTYYVIGEKKSVDAFVKFNDPFMMPEGGTVYFFAKDEESGYKTEIRKEHISIASGNWKVLSKTSQDKYSGELCIDNNARTFSEISATKNQKPALIVDLKKKTTFNAFGYLPRQDGEKEGIIFEYELQMSKDGRRWESIKSGTLNNIENNPNRRIISLEKAHSARYLKLLATSGIRDVNSMTIAEFELFNLKNEKK